MSGKRKIFLSDWELSRMLSENPAAKIPENAIISPLYKERTTLERDVGLYRLKKEIAETGRRLYSLGFVPATDGNISVKLGNGNILITASGVSKGRLKAEDISEIDPAGNLLKGKKPSSEKMLHLKIYGERPDINAVVHAHPPAATAFSCCGRDLSEPLTSEMVIMLGKVPLAEYAAPGSEEVPLSIAPHIKYHNAVLLSNHGVVTCGKDLEQAFQRMETVEHFAKITFYAEKLGEKRIISPAKIKELEKLRKNRN